MPVASLRLPATPDQVRTARLVAAAAARRSGVPEEQLDEVRLAVGEATARAVLRHAGDGRVEVTFHDGDEEFTVEVRDGLPAGGATLTTPSGRATAGAPEGDEEDLSLALIEALPDRVQVSRDDRGEVLTLVWLLPAVTDDDEPGPHAGPAAAPA